MCCRIVAERPAELFNPRPTKCRPSNTMTGPHRNFAGRLCVDAQMKGGSIQSFVNRSGFRRVNRNSSMSPLESLPDVLEWLLFRIFVDPGEEQLRNRRRKHSDHCSGRLRLLLGVPWHVTTHSMRRSHARGRRMRLVKSQPI